MRACVFRFTALRPLAFGVVVFFALPACMPETAERAPDAQDAAPAASGSAAPNTPAAKPSRTAVMPEDTCGAGPQIMLVGEYVDGRSFEGLAPIVRVIGPKQAVTKDYRPNRLNIEYDNKGMIRRLFCG